jgi:AcrR family transcriptional regulator
MPRPSAADRDAAPGRAKPASLREQQKLFTRQRLVDAALEVFGAQGYAPATVDDIAAAAGASRATFYLHFQSKLELVRALSADLMPEIEASCQELGQVLAGGSAESLRDWIDRAMAWFAAHRTFVRTLAEVQALEGGQSLAGLPSTADLDAATADYVKRLPKRDRERARLNVVLLIAEVGLALRLLEAGGYDVPRERLADELSASWSGRLGLA